MQWDEKLICILNKWCGSKISNGDLHGGMWRTSLSRLFVLLLLCLSSRAQGPSFPWPPANACFSGSWHHVLKLLFSLRKPSTDIITAVCIVSENRLTSLPFHFARRLVFIHCRVNRVSMWGSEFMNEEEHVWEAECLVSEGEGSDKPCPSLSFF